MRIVSSRSLPFAFAVLLGIVAVRTATAQTPSSASQDQHQQPMPMQMPMPAAPQTDQQMPAAREASGTAWLPDATPMYAVHAMKGPWTLMFHDNAFLQYLKESGDRGDDQFGSINWFMGMAQRNAGPGRVVFRGMFSLEPWTIPGCGYPDLLASGELCNGEKIHDRQHPHDLMMELSAS